MRRADSRPSQKKEALETLAVMCRDVPDSVAAFHAAGAISPLVKLLGADCPEEQLDAAGACGLLARDAASAATVIAAGAIPALVKLLGSGFSTAVQSNATGSLTLIARSSVENALAIVAAGALPPLVQLLGRGTPALGLENAAEALLGGDGVKNPPG
ncbi:hypothetical protein FOA52_000381 [Chlamydomonas sp. UWO 241]|nr:hypothetical protein FOA52_000381 [Chlamydomonas sp. UWO 241]